MISVGLIEDRRLMREGITALLNQTTHCRVVAAGSSCDTEMLRRANPQVILLDLGQSNGDSLRIAERVRQGFPAAKVVVMDLVPSHADIMEFVNAGVSGFIMQDATGEELVTTICSVAAGKNVLPLEMTSSLFTEMVKDSVGRTRSDASDSVKLTPREKEVIALIGAGLSNKAIARRLGVAPQTAKSHVRNIMDKLSVHTRLQIAAYSHSLTAILTLPHKG